MTEFQLQCLNAHNEYRSKHKVPPLTLNQGMCNYAQEWANYIASSSMMQHRSNNKYGENIYCSFNNNLNHIENGKNSVDSWYSEINKHYFGMEPRSLATGHFTQVVWKESKQLGVGVARNSRGHIYVVCNYDPPGNYSGRYVQNVPPVGGFS